MTVAEYIVDELIKYDVMDAFGVPGGVILRILYAMQLRIPEMTPHLNYHEQMAGFAACGYAQAGNRLGVAYATRGPGITNMITCMAEAYQESLPVLFMTAYHNVNKNEARFEYSQEVDLTESVSKFTKYAARIASMEELPSILQQACSSALTGRKGPVFLDFYAALLGKNITPILKRKLLTQQCMNINFGESENIVKYIQKKVRDAKRPVILIGDGVRQVKNNTLFKNLISLIGVPVLSSRAAQDLCNQSELYFGYIGSHGTRYSNFIMSKSDLIIALGNRLAFPLGSESFLQIANHADIIRLDIDKKEFTRKIPNTVNFCIDLNSFVSYCATVQIALERKEAWIEVCNELKSRLEDCDITMPVKKLIQYLQKEKAGRTYVCDVGNNEFWFARAFEKVRKSGVLLYSKSYGTLGAALGRAIGAYYASKKEVVCIMGDQGFQYNIQELQYIGYWKIPVKIIVLNNACSEMILDHERILFGDVFLHVTEKTGYGTPDFKSIAQAYNIPYIKELDTENELPAAPFIYECYYHREKGLVPYLPKGNVCQNMAPIIDQKLYCYLQNL